MSYLSVVQYPQKHQNLNELRKSPKSPLIIRHLFKKIHRPTDSLNSSAIVFSVTSCCISNPKDKMFTSFLLCQTSTIKICLPRSGCQNTKPFVTAVYKCKHTYEWADRCDFEVLWRLSIIERISLTEIVLKAEKAEGYKTQNLTKL